MSLSTVAGRRSSMKFSSYIAKQRGVSEKGREQWSLKGPADLLKQVEASCPVSGREEANHTGHNAMLVLLPLQQLAQLQQG